MPTNDQLAQQLLAGSGGVGMIDVQPQRIGANVYPTYVGVPAVPRDAASASPEQKIIYGRRQYTAGDVTWIGFGQTTIGAGLTVNVTIPVVRPFNPQKLFCPSTIVGLLLLNTTFQGTGIFANAQGVPIELFSEVSTAPQILWPTIDPATGVVFSVFNPTVGALVFSGGMYGTDVRL
jgi:hypothetical protein